MQLFVLVSCCFGVFVRPILCVCCSCVRYLLDDHLKFDGNMVLTLSTTRFSTVCTQFAPAGSCEFTTVTRLTLRNLLPKVAAATPGTAAPVAFTGDACMPTFTPVTLSSALHAGGTAGGGNNSVGGGSVRRSRTSSLASAASGGGGEADEDEGVSAEADTASEVSAAGAAPLVPDAALPAAPEAAGPAEHSPPGTARLADVQEVSVVETVEREEATTAVVTTTTIVQAEVSAGGSTPEPPPRHRAPVVMAMDAFLAKAPPPVQPSTPVTLPSADTVSVDSAHTPPRQVHRVDAGPSSVASSSVASSAAQQRQFAPTPTMERVGVPALQFAAQFHLLELVEDLRAVSIAWGELGSL